MTLVLDHQFREQISHADAGFPISFFQDELAVLPDRIGPLHWHPGFEIAAAQHASLDFQIGREHLILNPGDCIFINANVLHSIRQISGTEPDPLPNIVFDASLVAAEDSLISRRYIQPIRACSALPCVLFRHDDESRGGLLRAVREIFSCFQDRRPCGEMAVQRGLSVVFEYLALHFTALPKVDATRVQLTTQVRMQQMLSFIHGHFAEEITLNDIAHAASISRSEAGRCFHAYMGCSPVDVLIRFRLQTARAMLHDSEIPLNEISRACSFHSVGYFSRQFRRYYGCPPGSVRRLGR